MDFQKLLNKWSIKCDINVILSMWNESHRSYHSLNHLNELVYSINENKKKYSEKEYEKLLLTAIFHDIIYDPKDNQNEEKSADFFINCCVDRDNIDIVEVKQAILDTKTHKATTKISEEFNNLDMNIVERDFDKLLEWENGIYEEYKIFGNEAYKDGRLKFLESLLDKYPHNTNNLLKLIEYVKENY
jgi:pantetheine-phosphate adenylyltransferase